MSRASIPLLPHTGMLPAVPQIIGGGEYAALSQITAETVGATLGHGYIPMTPGARGPSLLLVKCHLRRALLNWEHLHLPRNTRRYARGLRLLINHDPRGAIHRSHTAHADSWLNPQLQEALAELAETSEHGVRVVTAELHDEAGHPVAGELGSMCGTVYTSLSGWHARNGAGWALLGSFAAVLQQAGVSLWDLGMSIDYKLRFGARELDRDAFLLRFRAAADAAPLSLGAAGEAYDAPELVNRTRTLVAGDG